jgi:hypothetical protein
MAAGGRGVKYEDAVKLGRAFWRKLGIELVKSIRARTAKGRGVHGRFPAYSKGYRRAKAKGGMNRQSSQQVSPPNLTLTGDLMADLQAVSVTDYMTRIGWPAEGAKVEWLAEHGRAVTTDERPLTRSEITYIDQRITQARDARLKAAGKPRRYRIKL